MFPKDVFYRRHIFSTEEGWIEKCWTFVFVLHVTFVRKEQRIEVLYLGKPRKEELFCTGEKEPVLYNGKGPGKRNCFVRENPKKPWKEEVLLNTFD